jgi:hypothetical protein
LGPHEVVVQRTVLKNLLTTVLPAEEV